MPKKPAAQGKPEARKGGRKPDAPAKAAAKQNAASGEAQARGAKATASDDAPARGAQAKATASGAVASAKGTRAKPVGASSGRGPQAKQAGSAQGAAPARRAQAKSAGGGTSSGGDREASSKTRGDSSLPIGATAAALEVRGPVSHEQPGALLAEELFDEPDAPGQLEAGEREPREVEAQSTRVSHGADSRESSDGLEPDEAGRLGTLLSIRHVSKNLSARESPGADSTEAPAPAPSRGAPVPNTRSPLSEGEVDTEVLRVSELAPVEGRFDGIPLLLLAEPEVFRTPGVLGSTMGKTVPGKSEAGPTFPGAVRLFTQAINRVGETFVETEDGRQARSTPPSDEQRFSVVLRNTSGRPIHLHVKGCLYSKYLTPQFPRPADGGAPFNPRDENPLDEDLTGLVAPGKGRAKVPDPRGLFFRGPHAVLAAGWLDACVDDREDAERERAPLVRDDLDLSRLDSARLGTRGYLEGSVVVKPGATVVVLEARHERGGTLRALLDFVARDAKGGVDAGARFRLATVASPRSLTDEDLAALVRGEYPQAEMGAPVAPRRGDAFDAIQGVVDAGSRFLGGRTLPLSRGTRTGDLVMSTMTRNAGARHDAGVLAGSTRSNDGARGTTFELTYVLENPGDEDLEVELLVTSPRVQAGERFFPQAGVLMLAMRVDGQRMEVRLDERGAGRVLSVLDIPASDRREVRVEWTHVGGSFAPLGLEFRARG
ncbi:hypothetical protein LY474_17670 [Myxococcus stipitatus]|uniref:hypothetical protein n=1 Tax=Myxococcus stipitatus TaxID=83455 RepID=UPI001F26D927|nr:hypothetical protein [Myxococcus stipitatus]MCE9669627.1 hypothetical protein [Myxococcus stipitatus]